MAPVVSCSFLGLFLWEALVTHHRRLGDAWRSVTSGRPVRTEPLDPECLARHPWDPGLCAMKRPARDAVEWLRSRFAPRERPIPFAADVAVRLRMHYYAQVRWNGRREARCALVYSSDLAYLRGWLAQPRFVSVSPTTVLEVPERSPSGSGRYLQAFTAVEACRSLVATPAPSPPDPLALCRATPPSPESVLRVLGLGGIDVRATMVPSPTGWSVEARALFVSAGVSIEAVALLLIGPNGSEVAHHVQSQVEAFSRAATHAFPLPDAGRPAPWTVKACLVDSEGFAVAATARTAGR